MIVKRVKGHKREILAVSKAKKWGKERKECKKGRNIFSLKLLKGY